MEDQLDEIRVDFNPDTTAKVISDFEIKQLVAELRAVKIEMAEIRNLIIVHTNVFCLFYIIFMKINSIRY